MLGLINRTLDRVSDGLDRLTVSMNTLAVTMNTLAAAVVAHDAKLKHTTDS